MTTIPQIQAHDAPDMVALLLNVLLFKLGGQVSITLDEIATIKDEFPNLRIAFLADNIVPANSQLILTSRSARPENDRPQ
jgi:hypothetical protein